MCFTAIATLGAAAIGAVSSRNASRRQARAANNQLGVQRQIHADNLARSQPFVDAGTNALAAYNYELGMGARPDGYEGYTASPGYDFQLDQGMRAIEGSAAAGGNVRSGATMKALQQFGTGLAAQDYGNHMNRLAGVMGMGQASAANQAASGANFAAGASNAYGNIGNAQSAGIIGTNNAIQGGINNALSAYQMNQVMGGSSPSVNLPAQSAAGQAVFGQGRWF